LHEENNALHEYSTTNASKNEKIPNSVTMIKRSSLILISSAAEAHFFVPEYHLTDIIYNTNMDSRKSCSTHSFLSFVFGCLQGSELTAGTFLYILYIREEFLHGI
jgi:hypothetical protein